MSDSPKTTIAEVLAECPRCGVPPARQGGCVSRLTQQCPAGGAPKTTGWQPIYTTEPSMRERLLSEAAALQAAAAAKRQEAARLLEAADNLEAAAEGYQIRAEGMPYG